MENTQQPNNSTSIEFNSMVACLKRLDRLTYQINEERDSGHYPEMLDAIIGYFKEISPDLTTNQMKECWEEIQKIKRFLNPANEINNYFVLRKLDEIDIKLRLYAKEHGFLTRTAKDVKKSILEM